jgi:hypothetical protein
MFDGHAYYISVLVQFNQNIFIQVFCNGDLTVAEINQGRVCIFETGDCHFAKMEKNH